VIRATNVELWLSLEPGTRLVSVELGADIHWNPRDLPNIPRRVNGECDCCCGEHTVETYTGLRLDGRDAQTRTVATHVQVMTADAEGEPTVHDLWVCRTCEAEFITEQQGLRNVVMMNQLAKSLRDDAEIFGSEDEAAQ
jgi:hypothetical protein